LAGDIRNIPLALVKSKKKKTIDLNKYAMRITISELRRIIRSVISETGGGIIPKLPVIRNAMGPEMSDREQLGRLAKDRDPDEIAPHLTEPMYDDDDVWGPVPPTGENPYAIPDPYTKDTSVLPTPPIKR
jgi:hypothetical protein